MLDLVQINANFNINFNLRITKYSISQSRCSKISIYLYAQVIKRCKRTFNLRLLNDFPKNTFIWRFDRKLPRDVFNGITFQMSYKYIVFVQCFRGKSAVTPKGWLLARE